MEQPSQAVVGPLERTVRPAAWIQHHKAGDNLEWEDPGGKRTALYDEQTLWNACARVGEIERGKLADDIADALRFRWLCRYPDWHFIEHLCRQTTASTSAEFLADLRRVIDARRSVELGPLEQHVPPRA